MAANSPDSNERAAIRRFAAEPSLVRITRTAQYDLLGHELTKVEICAEIVAWIESGWHQEGGVAWSTRWHSRLRDETPHQ